MYFENIQYLYYLPLTALPLIIYLIFRKKPKRLVFSSLFLLKNLTKNVNRRTKIKDIILLIIRTLLILSLILLFAAPFIGDRSDFDPGKNTTAVFYFDTGSSMADAFNGGSKFDTARNMLIKTINGIPQSTSIYIMTSDPDEKFKGNKKDALKFLSSLEIYGRERSLNEIELFADSLFNKISGTNKILMALTDGFTPYEMRKDNGSDYLKKALIFRSDEDRKEDISIDSVQIVNRTFLFFKLSSLSGKSTRLDIFQDGRKIFAQEITFGNDMSKTVSVELKELGNSGAAVSAEISDERSNSLNNSYHFVIPALEKKKMLIVGDKESQAVRSILTLVNTNPDSILIPEVIAPDAVNSVKYNNFSLIFFCGMSHLSSFTAGALKNYITAGSSVYFSSGDKLNLNDYNSNLVPTLGFPDISGYEKLPDSYAGIKINDLKHPVFKDVFSENFTGINSAEIFNYYKVKGRGWISLISVGGDPLLMEKKLGEGKIFFLTAGLEKQNSNILENGISVPILLNSFIFLIGNDLESENSSYVGDMIGSDNYFYLIKPGKNFEQGTDELSKRFFLKKPGFYKTYSDDGIFTKTTAVNYERENYDDNTDLIRKSFNSVLITDSDYKDADLISFESKDLRNGLLILILILLCSEILIVRFIK
jgi:hypothetical protein